MPHCLTVLPDSMMIDACLDHERIEGTADLLGVSVPDVVADLLRRGLGTHLEIRSERGLETHSPSSSPMPMSFVLAFADGRIKRGGKNLGTDLRTPLPGVKL